METVSQYTPALHAARALQRIDQQLLDTRQFEADLLLNHTALLGELATAVVEFLAQDREYTPDPEILEAIGGDFSRGVLMRAAIACGYVLSNHRSDEQVFQETVGGAEVGIISRIEAVTP